MRPADRYLSARRPGWPIVGFATATSGRLRRGPPCRRFEPYNGTRYSGVMIHDFADKETEKIWRQQVSRRLPGEIQQTALRKLFMLDKAQSLDDLRIPPANRLEALKGDRKGQHSIRINDQWRICFIWTRRGAEAVEIVDYH